MTLPRLSAGVPALAVDVGGTGIKAGIVAADGSMVSTGTAPTPVDRAGSADVVIEAVVGLRDRLVEHTGVRPQRAGVLVPGVVDDATGTGVFSENLYWRDVPFADRFTHRLGVPTRVMHDVRGAGLAEYALGGAGAYRDVMVLTIGTGIAGAVFVDGRGYAGGGFAGEVGHTTVDPAGPACACGRVGCLEAIASAAAIARAYTARTGTAVDGARGVLEAVDAGDTDAMAVWNSALDALATGLAQVATILAPEAVLIGGGLSSAGDRLIVPLRERLDAVLTFQRRPVIERARIGADAGLLGAALLTRDVASDRRTR